VSIIETNGRKAAVVILRDGKKQTLTLEPADGA